MSGMAGRCCSWWLTWLAGWMQKPQKLRHLLSSYGELGRVYLAPEDSALRRKRKREGGNTGKNFTEGWVEFEDKRMAKRVAGMLNGKPHWRQASLCLPR